MKERPVMAIERVIVAGCRGMQILQTQHLDHADTEKAFTQPLLSMSPAVPNSSAFGSIKSVDEGLLSPSL